MFEYDDELDAEPVWSEPEVDDLGDYSDLADEHARELADSAVPASVAAEQGVFTAYAAEDLPAWARWIYEANGDAVLPAIVYPMTQPDGSETGQVKPAPGSVTNADGHVLKYVSPGRNDNPVKLSALREVDAPEKVLIVEGVKQALAALAWAPETWSIYRIAGIWSWMVAGDGDEPGSPTEQLSVVLDQDVVIVPDADAKSNPRVFDGAKALGDACKDFGAKSARFARLPGAGKEGVDDLLAACADDEKRRNLLKAWVKNSKAKPADLDKRQLNQLRSRLAEDRAEEDLEAVLSDEGAFEGRRGIDVGSDPRQVTLDLFEELSLKRGGTTVFKRNSGMVRLERNDAGALVSNELGMHGLHKELLNVACPYTLVKNEPKRVVLGNALLGIVADHWNELPQLQGVTRTPVVRPDGTVNAANGYDAETGMVLDLTEDVLGLEVPEHPSDSDLKDAVSLLRDDLFAPDGAGGYDGWVFKDVSDQANALAALITPTVRAMTGPAPLFLLDGLQPGVGKGGAVDTISKICFGTHAKPQATPKSDEEMDKRISAALLDSADSIILDEVQDEDGTCRLESAALRAALTAEVYSGRELAKTRMLSLPNLATWFGLGNNVQVPRDMARRVVPIRLSSDRPDLENRDYFRHDLGVWIPQMRGKLLAAVLTMVRAWFDRGQPEAPRSFGFASFSTWQRVLGGILHLAGVEGFLGNVMEVRQSADSEAVDNLEHWTWVESAFPAGTRFGAGEVIKQAKLDPDAPPPYGRSWDELDARGLSAYYGQHPKWYGDLRIRHDGKLHGSGKAYVIDVLPSNVAPIPSTVASAPTSAPSPSSDLRPAAGAAPGEVIEFTDRKGFKLTVPRAMPPMRGKTIAELGEEDA
ncbi:hypothetical protein [Brachybacterium sp. NPDC056505]|uniref:hypothetical protein n=1 Tax=Brachybacterium sp. NPDC056505 TaxID=3345843 RepID=UPI00366E898A